VSEPLEQPGQSAPQPNGSLAVEHHEGFLVGEVGGPDLTGVFLTVEGVEQALLLPVGEPFETFQQDHPGPPQQVDLPAPATLGLAHRAPSDLIDSPAEQAEDVEAFDDQPGVGQQVADNLA